MGADRYESADRPQEQAFPPPVVYVNEKPAWEYKKVRRILAKEEAPTIYFCDI